MLRSSLFTASAFALVASAAAQTPQQINAEKVPGAIKHAGTYHVATGTWTRTGGATANFGTADIIYSNTAGSGYFTTFGGAGGGAPGSENFDEGGLPGTTNGNPFLTGPDRDCYAVNGFQIGYCDLSAIPGSGGWDINFYADYDPCTVAANPASGTAVVANLPTSGCWIVEVDLTGAEICMQADGGPSAPGWDNDEALDSFGWSYTYSGTDGTASAGFLLAGDPNSTDPTWVVGGTPLDGTNTYYGAASLCTTGGGLSGMDPEGTGYLTRDFWWLEDPAATSSNCYFFGGYRNVNGCGGPSGTPYASFHMEILADPGPCGDPIISMPYCMSNPNSGGVNTSFRVIGDDTAANNNARLVARDVPLNSFGFFITSQTPGFTANPAGSIGNICVTGNIGRFVAAGQIKNAFATGEIVLDTTAGEWDLAAIPTSTGPYAAMAGIRSHFQLWHRDTNMGMAVSNFSDAEFVDWQ